MPGQHEQWSGLDRLDPRDSTLLLAPPSPVSQSDPSPEPVPPAAAEPQPVPPAEPDPPAEPAGPSEPRPDPPHRDARDAGTEKPAPGSRADLRQRLERLPYGHPSSPYHVDGERKPPPPRLKHLELAPPTPSRFSTAGAGGSPPRAGVAGVNAAAAAAVGPVPAPPPLTDLAAPAEERAVQTSDAAPTAAAVDHDDVWMPTSAPAEAEGPAEGESPAEAEAPAVPAGPQTAFDGSWTWGAATLSPDQTRVANEAYDRFRAAEGRNLFGSYGSGGLTVLLRAIAQNLEFGQLAPDAELNSLLDPDTFKARFADMLTRYPDRTAERLARRVPGAISYAFVFDNERYSEGIWKVEEVLAAYGFQLLARRNDWHSAANRWVATMWHDPSSDLPFGVQFHTRASLEAQRLGRSSAALMQDPRIPPAEAANLQSDLAAAWAAVPAPPGNGQISDYRRSGARSSADRRRAGLPPDQSTPLSAGAGDRLPAENAGSERLPRWPPPSGTDP